MNNELLYVIREGRYYKATNVGGKTWMVKRFEIMPVDEASDPYVEQELSSDATDQETVIDQAIARDSWA